MKKTFVLLILLTICMSTWIIWGIKQKNEANSQLSALQTADILQIVCTASGRSAQISNKKEIDKFLELLNQIDLGFPQFAHAVKPGQQMYQITVVMVNNQKLEFTLPYFQLKDPDSLYFSAKGSEQLIMLIKNLLGMESAHEK